MSEGPPTFDGERFAARLTGWMDGEEIETKELVARTGLGRHTIGDMRHNHIPAVARQRGQKARQYNVNTIAAVAYGLRLSFGYVASWAGLDDDGDRWQNFSPRERARIARALGGSVERLDELLRNQPDE